MSYTVKLEVFEGPFDLLFHLIERAKVDIYNIPIAKITEQYLQYIEDMKRFDLDITSEFLVMAATLIEIKSKMLLPDRKEEQLSLDMVEEDPRQELVRRLIEYKKYKNVALELKKREEFHKKIFYKPQEQLDQYIHYDTKELVDLDLSDLLKAFNNLITKRRKYYHKQIQVTNIEREEISIQQKIEQIKDKLKTNNHLHFAQLFINPYRRSEIIVTFLALLELTRNKFLIIKQDRVFGNIIIKKIVHNIEV